MQTKNSVGSAPAVADDDMDEAPILTDADVGEVEVFEGNTFIKRGRGRPPTGNAKELMSVRLSRDVVAKLREAGPGWQSQVDTLLRTALGLARPPMVEIPGMSGPLRLDTTVTDRRREYAAEQAAKAAD